MAKASRHAKPARGDRGFLLGLFIVATALSFAVSEFVNGDYRRPAALQTSATTVAPTALAAKLRADISQRQAAYLARTTLKSLHDAVRTGNFTVLRDLAGPSLQARYASAELHQHFARNGATGMNLAAVSLLNPVLTAAKPMPGSTAIRIDGYFPSLPAILPFAMIVEPHSGRWLIADYAIGAQQANVATAAQPPTTSSIR